MTILGTLGAFAAESSPVPAEVRAATRRAVLNALGCGMGAAADPAIALLSSVLPPGATRDPATVIGQGRAREMGDAAFLNAAAMNLMDFDDTHLATIIHPTAPVLAAALAFAEARDMGGAALLEAVAVGMEVACRLGLAVSPGHYARGWHITATCGGPGAAAAVARLMGLDAGRAAHAVGIAANAAAGMVVNLAHGAKNVCVGEAARHGILAALLAQAGLTAAADTIESSLGWAGAMGEAPTAAAVTDGLGARWEVERNAFKPYPTGVVMHAVIDACLALRAAGLDAAEVETLVVTGDALLLARGDRAATDSRDCRVSTPHCAAVALVRGRAGVAEFTLEAVRDEAVAALRTWVRLAVDPAMPTGAARVEAVLRDGTRRVETVLHATGSLARPLDDGAIAAKVAGLAGAAAGAALVAAVGALEDGQARGLARVLRPG